VPALFLGHTAVVNGNWVTYISAN